MLWNADEHSDEENLRWCWLRAVEWGRWPLFIAQPVAPVLLMFYPWKSVVLGVIVGNFLWAIVRYSVVSVDLAYLGALFVHSKWLVSLVTGVLLLHRDDYFVAALAGFWPLVTLVIGVLPTTQIGKLQKLFMRELGYGHMGRGGGQAKDETIPVSIEGRKHNPVPLAREGQGELWDGGEEEAEVPSAEEDLDCPDSDNDIHPALKEILKERHRRGRS